MWRLCCSFSYLDTPCPVYYFLAPLTRGISFEFRNSDDGEVSPPFILENTFLTTKEKKRERESYARRSDVGTGDGELSILCVEKERIGEQWLLRSFLTLRTNLLEAARQRAEGECCSFGLIKRQLRAGSCHCRLWVM